MKINSKSILKLTVLFLPFLLLLFSSCNTEEGKEFASFFIGFVVFLVGTIIVGIPGIVLSAISISSPQKSVPILAIVFTALYLIFFLIMMSVFGQSPAANLDGSIMIFPVINVAIVIMNSVFIYMGFKSRRNQPVSKADERSQLLDDILNEEDKDLI
ncbi:MAG: hypothetical protein H6599_06270 [Flavobacteriales bacterium]|nr:hypothetical protein [Flavobacteriales bacterium]